jgi:hypothetical protein
LLRLFYRLYCDSCFVYVVAEKHEYHAVVDSEKDIDKLQNPFSDPSDKKLTDIEILRKELKALKKRTSNVKNS